MQKQPRKATGQKHVQDHAPRHRRASLHEETEQKRRVENVSVHGRYIWHPAKQEGIPQRERPGASQPLRREIAKRIPGDVLVAIGIEQRLPGERRMGEHQCTDREDHNGHRDALHQGRGDDVLVLRLGIVRWTVNAGSSGHAKLDGLGGSGKFSSMPQK